MADTSVTVTALASDNNNPQPLLDYAQTLITGEELMFTMDVPYVPAQETTISLAQADAPAGATPQPDFILKECQQTESSGDPTSAFHAVNPAGMLASYIGNYVERRLVEVGDIKNVTMLQDATVGKITSVVDNVGRSWYRYDPPANYTGNDKAVFLAEYQGKVYKIVVNLVVTPTVGETPLMIGEKPVCPPPKLIKVTKPSTGASGFGAGYDISSVSVSFADLTGSSLGQTNVSGITLDTNAAGYNWFIDTTPADNSEFLPTSNPNEWVAKAGSAAAGKMDMLSVLLHEYGHALGINHSADPNDFMGTTLTAGVRRLPSAEEMALMQNLIAQAKDSLTPTLSQGERGQTPMPFPTLPLGTSFIGFLGLLRGSRYGGVSVAADASTLVTQYDWAANPTLTNGNLTSANGWSTQGSVNIANGAAVMNEVSGTQTRLSQVFLLNPSDRTLSFTLAGTALDDLTGAPDDAFEVALLDANTGASLLSGTGQTRTDAFLNLQADGTQSFANCVTCTTNADGSRTYLVDLAGIPAGTAANLSFDLIGFGQNGSHVTVRDVNLNGASGLQHLHDDTATILEDSSLAFDPYAQVAGGAGSFAASLVNAPSHGAVSVNADGTFSYTPQADYNGTDSFTYRLSAGTTETNLATVNITLTPVNDAPVVADVQATTAEDTALVIALGAYATDVDSATLTTQIVTGPAHGVLTQNADGSYTYAPNANYHGADRFTYQATDGALNSNTATVTLNVTPVNHAPTLGNLNLAAVEDTALAMNLLAAATDIEGDKLTAAIVAGAQHGQVSINADGSFTYTPELNFNGVDSFTYKVNDGLLDSNIATVTLTVAAVNDAPVAADAAVTTAEDTALVIDLFAYATDVDTPSPQPFGGIAVGGCIKLNSIKPSSPLLEPALQ
jgi:VCBS repeat-containing protein